MRTTVLLPVRLHEALKAIADRDRRSLHQEIIYALEQFASSQRQRRAPGGPPESDPFWDPSTYLGGSERKPE